MELKQSQKDKLDNLTVEKLSDKKITELLNAWKVLEGEKAEEEFEKEYDELFDEFETVCKISLKEFQTIAPKLYEKIGGTEGSKIYQGIKKGLLTIDLTRKVNVDKKIESIQNNNHLSKEKKDSIIENRKAILKEVEKLQEKGVEVDANIAWKIWRVEEGKRAKNYIPEKNLEKDLASISYLGKEFVDELKAYKFGEIE